jgi:hypothetical protein
LLPSPLEYGKSKLTIEGVGSFERQEAADEEQLSSIASHQQIHFPHQTAAAPD